MANDITTTTTTETANPNPENNVNQPAVDINNLPPEVKAMVEKILASKTAVSHGHRGRPANPNVVHLTCKACGKVVTYRDTDDDKIGLEKRIEKSQKTREEFMANFKCRACAGIVRKQAEEVVKAMLAQQAPTTNAQGSATPATATTPAPDGKVKSGKKAKTPKALAATTDIPAADSQPTPPAATETPSSNG